mmetsp:Transcript_38994/g.50424  ORF Transcript_38994/g.50424 Transcript_38994/m.50424 type:complete len:630 (-) Transcript_38994:69-1958(-)
MLASHNTFGGVLNISDVISKKSTLRKVNETVFTRHDGSRYTQNNIDGTYSDLPASSRDADGQWAILDESSPSPEISRNESESKSKEIDSSFQNETENKTKPISESESVLVNILKQHPELSQYLIFLKVGVPISTIKSKMTHEGVDIKLPKEILESFYRALDNGNGNNNTSSSDIEESDNKEPNEININELNEAIGESKDIYHKESSPLGKPMKGNYYEIHGHLAKSNWDHPILASYSNTPARAGYNTEMGHEYLDSPKVLKEKVKLLAQILLKAKKTVIYAGAGLSTASGIGDYATQTGKSGVLAQSGHKGANISPFCVKPNFGHHCITALSKKGLIHKFVQQNHDGLPQKAGMNQGLINEIHGGWFDPSNPVVAMSGGLRSDLFEDLLNLEKETDFVIAVGSSLCGMNADRLVKSSAQRARLYRNSTNKKKTSTNADENSGAEYGSVIISLQKTVHDHNSSLRIFALIDDVFKLLAEELNLQQLDRRAEEEEEEGEVNSKIQNNKVDGNEVVVEEDQTTFLIPYDINGNRIDDKTTTTTTTTNKKMMRLDLSDGAELFISGGPDEGAKATVMGRNKDGHYRISVERKFKKGSQRAFTETRLLGKWWPLNAMDGDVEYIPVVNRSPEFV